MPSPKSFNPKKQNPRKGQVIVEAIVALGVLTVGYIAILALLNRSLGVSSIISDQNTATYLAAEGMEVVGNLINAKIGKGCHFNNSGPCAGSFGFGIGFYEVSYNTLLEADQPAADSDTKDPGRVLNGTGWPNAQFLNFESDKNNPNYGYNYISGSATKFKRVIEVDNPAPPAVKYIHVISTVRWATKGGGSSEVRLEDFFFDNQP